MTRAPAIRPLRPTHAVALRGFDARPGCQEITAPSWPRVHEAGAGLTLWNLFSDSVAHPTGQRRAWVHRGAEGIDGLVVARVRCGGLVWDVRHLWVDGDRPGVALDLMIWICQEAASRGARRVFLETGRESNEVAIAEQAGFEQYAEAYLYQRPVLGQPDGSVLDSGPAADAGRGLPAAARARQRGDEHALFQLYKAAVPAGVRAAEAMTIEEWVALHKGDKSWAPGLLADRHQYVWEGDDAHLAWMELALGARSQHAEWLCHPNYEEASDALVADALALANPRLPLYATCRGYQPLLCSALERSAFALLSSSAVFARQLAIRVPARRLVAARARPTLTR